MRAIALCFVFLIASAADRLLAVQTLFRHGLRTPTETYASDPYTEAFWGVPWGELSTHGMAQQFTQGKRMRKMYVEDTPLVGAKYSRYETFVRSADYPRCSQSAQAQFAGFYAGSPTFSSDVIDWPSNSTPIPIHTVPYDQDHVLEGFEPQVCWKFAQLMYARQLTGEFQDFIASNWQLLYVINANWGEPEDYSYNAISTMFTSLSVEKDFNLTLPGWVTDEFYSELEIASNKGFEYSLGEGTYAWLETRCKLISSAGFGLPMNPELVKLSAGFLLNEWIGNINSTINGTSTVKYYSYSGHDVTITSLLIGLGVKQQLIDAILGQFEERVRHVYW
ncbi:hypothetical protein PFISCL1PPCAC_3128, partial [Pristionchus fissidentatus]